MSAPGKIAIENVNKPGSQKQVDAAKYAATKKALLAVLPSSSPGLTLSELKTRIIPLLPEALFPGGVKAGWWLMALQLDLRAKKQIECEHSKPLRFHQCTDKRPG